MSWGDLYLVRKINFEVIESQSPRFTFSGALKTVALCPVDIWTGQECSSLRSFRLPASSESAAQYAVGLVQCGEMQHHSGPTMKLSAVNMALKPCAFEMQLVLFSEFRRRRINTKCCPFAGNVYLAIPDSNYGLPF